jgi:hypothetical protein
MQKRSKENKSQKKQQKIIKTPTEEQICDCFDEKLQS